MCYHCKRYEGHKANKCPYKQKDGGGSSNGGHRYGNNNYSRGGRVGRNLSRGGGRGFKIVRYLEEVEEIIEAEGA